VTPAHEQDFDAEDPELNRLNEGLQAITDDAWKRALKTTYQTHFTGNVSKMCHNPDKAQEVVWEVLGPILNENATSHVAERLESLNTEDKKLCWDILQKVTAHEHNTRTYKDTTYNSQHVFNPYYSAERAANIYPNYSTALPLQKTYFPPHMEEPKYDLDAFEKMKNDMKPKRHEGQASFNGLTVASTVRDRWHPNDELEERPRNEQKEQYYGNNMLKNNYPGGPHTTYTNQACNPYTDQEALKAQREHQRSRGLQLEQNGAPTEKVDHQNCTTSHQDPVKDAVKSGGKTKVLSGKRAAQASSVPIDLGFTFPRTTYQGMYTDPASRGHNTNTMHPTIVNPLYLPTAVITGMATIGNQGPPNKSGPDPVAKGFCRKPTSNSQSNRPRTAGSARSSLSNTSRRYY